MLHYSWNKKALQNCVIGNRTDASPCEVNMTIKMLFTYFDRAV